MTLRNSERAYPSLQRIFSSFTEFFWEQSSENTWSLRLERTKSFVPKCFGRFNKKKLLLFDKCLITSICTKQRYHLKECVFVQYLEAAIKRCLETDRKTPVSESILKNLNFTKMVFITVVSLQIFKKFSKIV